MTGALICIFIDFFITLSILVRDDMGTTFKMYLFLILFIFVIISIIGTLLFRKSKKKSHGILAIVGFAFFVPIGFIGILSIRKQMDEILRTQNQNIRSEEK